MFNINTVISDLFDGQRRYGGRSAVRIYFEIIDKIDNTDIKLEEDSDFVRDVQNFFAIRYRTSEFMFNFCANIRKIRNNFGVYNIYSVSDDLINFSKSKREISFSSKLLHLSDPCHSFVIYDRNVRSCFKMKNIKSYEKLKIKFFAFKNEILSGNINNILCAEYVEFLGKFNIRLDECKIGLSENKKIDFYLWDRARYLDQYPIW